MNTPVVPGWSLAVAGSPVTARIPFMPKRCAPMILFCMAKTLRSLHVIWHTVSMPTCSWIRWARARLSARRIASGFSANVIASTTPVSFSAFAPLMTSAQSKWVGGSSSTSIGMRPLGKPLRSAPGESGISPSPVGMASSLVRALILLEGPLRCSLFLNSFMWVGVVPQQPPTSLAPILIISERPRAI